MTTGRLTIALAALLATGGLAFAQEPAPAGGGTQLSGAECLAIWSKADATGQGSLDQSQAQAYVTDFVAVDENGDGALSQIEFQNGCAKGLVSDSSMSGEGAGTEGMGDAPSESPAAPPQQ